ncbi:hypothetical protein MA12_gp14 [Pectobacterium phage MA12]|uniref:Uncharacterized protein n=1 Tax=Pectobacterium phage MA12 TaxID=2686474 RepID=A0A6B9RJW2_9CAUD|nr:hypothetical protein JT356_gp02 [Pectobacterium phage MA11]YP_010000236.1 hypothetical protein JT357_gp14 [Pectobacterium phage MA12]QGF21027.1 hypothetical protein MA11_gp02 [Pectobacterium phage MA11]QHI00841.1 hypothetical protein MA12_gp14 [Pectobacterium phage MA12]
MQTIITKYKKGSSRITAVCWNGKASAQYEHALSSEDNHAFVAEKLVAGLNKSGRVKWAVIKAAPMPDNGWCFIVDYVPDVPPMHMAITVKFLSATDTKPARMKAFSWLVKKGIMVDYSSAISDASDIQQCARFAADVMLEAINDIAAEHQCQYAIADYVQTFDGDRLFTLKGV